MLKNLRKRLTNEKGQIGEILVILVLIILAILGTVKYIMPIFSKGGDVTRQSGEALNRFGEQLGTEMVGTEGQVVPGGTVIETINRYANTDKVTIEILSSKGESVETYTGNPDEPKYYSEYGTDAVNPTADYIIDKIERDPGTNKVTKIVYKIQPID